MIINKYQLIIFDWEGTLFNPSTQSLCSHTKDVLKQLVKLGKTLAICSSACQENIHKKLQLHEMTGLFSFYSCATSAIQKPNAQLITCLLNNAKFQAKDAVLIGDSVVDHALAHSSGIDFIGIHNLPIHPSQQKTMRIQQIIQLIEAQKF